MKKLSVVGIGPGKPEGMTVEAERAIEAAEVVVGYTAYIELVREHFAGKVFFDTPMRQEVDRCRAALDFALTRDVAVVCSGDSTIYGMASLIFELREAEAEKYGEVVISVIAGVTAASSGSALLGSPLGHDFAVISLSDLLTPWDLIEKRLECAAAGDFCIAIYNPSSRKRSDYLKKACDILMRTMNPSTVCAVASRIGREGESAEITTLGALADCQVDMFSTVFVGNSRTRNIGGKMVTPRGYRY